MSGPISGLGSIIVNGVRFDDSTRASRTKTAARAPHELKLGMMVEVQPSRSTTARRAPRRR